MHRPSTRPRRLDTMKIAIVGCWYIADSYLSTLGRYPHLELVGVWDHNPDRLRSLCNYWSVEPYESLHELLTDSSIETVINLTNPRSHFEISKCCLEAGKHV